MHRALLESNIFKYSAIDEAFEETLPYESFTSLGPPVEPEVLKRIAKLECSFKFLSDLSL